MNQVVALRPSRMPIAPVVAKEFDITPDKWRVLVEQIFPSAKSAESVTMALSYCRARGLDIYKKPVHIVPMWSSQAGRMVETVWPGIAEIRTTAARTGEYAGIDAVEFGPMTEREFHGSVKINNRWEEQSKKVRFPEWASVVAYRIVKGQKCAYHAKIFWEETYATAGKGELPNEMWSKRTRGQLDKCVEAAALRKAFPEEIGNMYAAEEMEGRQIFDNEDRHESTPKVPSPGPVPTPTPVETTGDPLKVPAPQTGPVPEVGISPLLDRRKKKDPDPGAITDADVVSETPRQPTATAHDKLLDELASKLSPGMPYDEVGELQDEYESMLDGAEDAVFSKFNSIIAEAKQNAGF